MQTTPKREIATHSFSSLKKMQVANMGPSVIPYSTRSIWPPVMTAASSILKFCWSFLDSSEKEMVEYHGSTDSEELVSSFQSCNISYEEVFWEKKHSASTPLHVDVLFRSLPSPATTESPPLSPGTAKMPFNIEKEFLTCSCPCCP